MQMIQEHYGIMNGRNYVL